jgi:hypothetical protein
MQNLHELERLDATALLSQLATELGDGDQTLTCLAFQLDGLHQALKTIEEFAAKAMSIRLMHVLADAPVPPQLRRLLSATVTSYANDLPLLRRRFGRALAEPVLDAVVQAAEQVLSLRQLLRSGVLALGQRVAQDQSVWLTKAARSRWLPDAERLRLRLARLDLEELSKNPARLAAERFEARLKALPPPQEEPEVQDPADEQAQRFSLLEID